MSKDPAYLLDILQNARLILTFIPGSLDAFASDLKSQYAAIRCFEIIGEATKRISTEFRQQHPEIAWKAMAGMRDVVIHDYDKVNIKKTWEFIQNDIPALIAQIEPLIPPNDEA